MSDLQAAGERPDEIDFSCQVCGVQCAIAPDPPERAVCPEHCPDHDYKHDKWRRSWFCTICDAEVPHDHWLLGPFEDDVI